MARVVKEVKRHFGSLTPVFTALRDKEWELSLSYLRELSERVYLVPLKHHRGEDLTKLYEKAKEVGFREVLFLDSAEQVLEIKEDLLVLGSLYLVGEVKESLEKSRMI